MTSRAERTPGRSQLGLCALATVLLTASAARADHTTFLYQLDSARVVGNASGGAGCTETFDAGLNGWVQAIGEAVASGGLVTFQNPGQHQDVLRTFYDLTLDREDIEAPAACHLVAGGGDATLTTEWVNHLPNTPGGFHGHLLLYQTSNPVITEGIFVSLANFEGLVASEIGVAPGLIVVQNKMRLDITNPSDIVLASAMELQTVAITEAQLAAAVGQRIYLRLFYDESAKTVEASYSLDGEATYQTPFTPVSTAFSSAGVGRFWATGDPLTPAMTATPSLGPIGAAGLAALLLVASAIRWRPRARR